MILFQQPTVKIGFQRDYNARRVNHWMCKEKIKIMQQLSNPRWRAPGREGRLLVSLEIRNTFIVTMTYLLHLFFPLLGIILDRGDLIISPSTARRLKIECVLYERWCSRLFLRAWHHWAMHSSASVLTVRMARRSIAYPSILEMILSVQCRRSTCATGRFILWTRWPCYLWGCLENSRRTLGEIPLIPLKLMLFFQAGQQ